MCKVVTMQLIFFLVFQKMQSRKGIKPGLSKKAQTPQKKKKKKSRDKKRELIHQLSYKRPTKKMVIIQYCGNILPPFHIRVGPTHHETHSHVRERKYTLNVSNKFPAERWKRWIRDQGVNLVPKVVLV